MKILIAGQFKSWALERHYARYLREYAEVDTFPAEDIFDDYYRKSFVHKAFFKLGFSAIYQKIARQLLQKAEAFRPDVLFVFKGMRIVPEALKALKSKGIHLANYNPDHPFLFSSRGSGNGNVTRSIGLYDLHLCYSRVVQQRLEREYPVRTAFLPFGYELSAGVFEAASKVGEIPRACFIGNPDRTRVEYLRVLAAAGVPVDVYGHGWAKALPAITNLQIHDAVYGDDFWKKMRAYRVQLNIFRPHNEGSHNMRTFEIPAVGGIMLAPDSPEHRAFFAGSKEIFIYKNKADLIAQAQRILNMPSSAAGAIRQQARQRSLAGEYAYKNRAEEVFVAFRQLIGQHSAAPEKHRV
ncbi:MAG: glycosyltransferase [Saprospiraceae bacterium]